MKSSGINYGGNTTNIDLATGIRYGVISQNSVSPEALDDLMAYGENRAWKLALDEALRERHLEPGTDDVDEDEVAEELSLHWEDRLGDYVYEKDGYVITGCLDNDLFVLKSPYYTYACFCSPCVPGAGDLNNALTDHDINGAPLTDAPFDTFPKVYCLGSDWFDDGKAPYAIFNVEKK